MAWLRKPTTAPGGSDVDVDTLNFGQLVAAVAFELTRPKRDEHNWALPKHERERDRRASKVALLRLRVRLFELVEHDPALARRLESAPSGPDRHAGPTERAERWLAGCFTHARNFQLDPRAELAEAEQAEEELARTATNRRQEHDRPDHQ